jgi:cobalt-zinc-cadmium efflux system outer membrane protein
MRIRHLLSGVWLCVFACAGAGAAAQAVTLAEVQRAAAANIDVSLARRALAAARGDVLAADHAPVPQLTAKASQMDLQHGIGAGNVFRDKRIDKSLGIDWTLERGGKRDARTAAAQAGVQAARADMQEVALQQQLSASAAFFDLLAAQEKLVQVQAVEASARQLAQAAQRRVRAGDLSKQDASRVEIEAERAAADVRSAIADKARAQLALGLVAGLPASPEATGGWADGVAEAGAPLDIEQRADVRAARERVQVAQRALDGAQALRKNDLTLGASYDHYPGTSTRLVELRLVVPLSGVLGYDYSGEVARAEAQLAQAQDQLEKTRRAAAADMARLEQDLAASGARSASYRERILPRAEEVAQAAEYAYGRGATSLTELIDARRTLRAVLLEAIAARADHARALTAWRLRRMASIDTADREAP